MKIGLFFGSFNPIHIGHMAIANYLVEFGPIDHLWFVVTPQNPMKRKITLLDNYQRLEMVHRAIEKDERFWASDIEFKLPKPNYTINTLAYLKEKYPKKEFYLIIGADNYIGLNKWKNWEVLSKNYKFLVYPRPGFDHTTIELGPNFEFIDAPMIEISSTFIREAFANEKDIRHFLHPSVYTYINEMNFYKKDFHIQKKPD